MRLALARIALFLLVLAASAPAAGPVRAEWTILYYDKDGRLVGMRRSDGDGSASNPEAADPGAPKDGTAVIARTPVERFEPDELLVADPPKGFEASVRLLGFSIIEKVSLRALALRVYRLRIPQGSTVPDALTRLRRQFPGVTVDANHVFDPSGLSRTPEIHARAVMGWNAAGADCGRGVRLGVVDGAVDVEHPALAGQKVDYRSFHAPGHRPGAIQHGTAIAAMMVGKGPWGGLLPAAQLKAANIFEMNKSGKVTANVFGLLKAVDWLVRERVHVLNLSVAGSNNEVLGQVLDKARKHGFLMVAAAGNGGSAAAPAYPAAYDYVIAVTAVDARRRIYPHANRGPYIDFAAPGVNIWTAVPGGGRVQSGTSFAAPYVSVLTALEAARGAARDAASARARLRAHVVDLGEPGRDRVFGWGLVKLARDCEGPARG
ncbi:MAG: S8 family serine peptidase [Kiloniellaceae bacterium]